MAENVFRHRKGALKNTPHEMNSLFLVKSLSTCGKHQRQRCKHNLERDLHPTNLYGNLTCACRFVSTLDVHWKSCPEEMLSTGTRTRRRRDEPNARDSFKQFFHTAEGLSSVQKTAAFSVQAAGGRCRPQVPPCDGRLCLRPTDPSPHLSRKTVTGCFVAEGPARCGQPPLAVCRRCPPSSQSCGRRASRWCDRGRQNSRRSLRG
jgi:hypothetical protein